MATPSATSRLRALANPKRAAELQWFFKTKPGQYGHGDKPYPAILDYLKTLPRKPD